MLRVMVPVLPAMHWFRRHENKMALMATLNCMPTQHASAQHTNVGCLLVYLVAKYLAQEGSTSTYHDVSAQNLIPSLLESGFKRLHKQQH